ncbi:hypothetical protein CH333_02435 [candidate division WOR-3 bacterium JGI_Cruoil_03_44_89]|uniref:DUF1841 domain-containing protein n=1 Tax=candidate division WOR-3 bacterium JGI_Cruoil_03_44_89 TaxID=1973748 RepID=A0A235BQ02_UNCW3|nr:MAG: hypothetical protein CH333_08135 [candidate division WOR-3 bacterium JGI_Cruoil_03_44_89]OYD16846.1 MAG: hypothetical protein CH333_02435 [candidate division WOR-3 bacterium JGI_Cruoil_03_44_89]
MDETTRQLRAQSRKIIHEIWVKLKKGEPLEGEYKTIGKALSEHKEYHNVWEFADVIDGADYEIDGTNPFLHIILHSTVKNQIASNNPKEVRETFQRLQSKGLSKHEAEHVIGRAVAFEIFNITKNKEPFNKKRFLKELKKAKDSISKE